MAGNKKTWVGIFIAIIGLAGVIYEANKTDPSRVLLTEATLEAQKTQAAQVTNTHPSSTIISPSGIGTPSPVTADIARWKNAGRDWKRSCINSETWHLYPVTLDLVAESPDDCYNLISYGITANQGNLAFVRSNVREKEFRGIVISIPNNVNIYFDLRVNHLENAEVWVGIMKNPIKWDGKYLRAKAGDSFNISTVTNNFPKHNDNYHEPTDPQIYHFQYSIEGNLWTVNYDGSPAPMFANEILSFSPRYLFIGYQAYAHGGVTGSIDTRISNLKIEER